MPIIILTAYDWSDIEAEAKEVGLEVDTAENGQAALNKVANASPGYYSLVLMDVMMPFMNGYEATKAIRKRFIKMGKFWLYVCICVAAILCPPLSLVLLFIVEG